MRLYYPNFYLPNPALPVAGLFLLLLAFGASPRFAYAQANGGATTAPADTPAKPAQPQGQASAAAALPAPFQLNGQVNVIGQTVSKFRSPYEGANSFLSRNETEVSEVYTLFFGARLRPNLDLYFDPEEAAGKGLSTSLGLAGFVNNDVIRNPTLSQQPYLARYFARWTIATGRGNQKVEGGQNQVAGTVPANRLVLSAGKVSAADYFDQNSYAGSSHTSFINWVLVNNGAWDYAADTRGYTNGVVAESIHPTYAARLGIFQMPTVANGTNYANRLNTNRGDNLEIEFHPAVLRKASAPLILRLLGYHNVAHMGNYAEAISQAEAEGNGTVPVIEGAEHAGNKKYGYGINFEQALGDDGATGMFGRFSWDDGRTESFVFTEADQAASGGVQWAGTKLFHRPQDHFAIAFAQNQLSAVHRDYLALGGLGFLLGDGRLNYGPEQIVEAYYCCRLTKDVTLSPDYQRITNPGYNQDRGPIRVGGLRLHAEF